MADVANKIVQVGGDFIDTLGNVVKDKVGTALIFYIKTGKKDGKRFAIGANKNMTEITNLLAAYGERVSYQGDTADVYGEHYARKILAQLDPILNQNFNNMIRYSSLKINIKLQIYVTTIPTDVTGQFAKYIEIISPGFGAAESSGTILFTPEFNLPTTFDNANFMRAEDDNYTAHAEQFINSPQFNLALYVRPKMFADPNDKICRRCRRHCDKITGDIGGCRKCKKRCQKKHHRKFKCKKFTSTIFLQNSVNLIYQFCQRIQREQITFEKGKAMIDDQIKRMSEYKAEGAAMYELEMIDGFLYMFFCTRYYLRNTDCIVGFMMQGYTDIFQGREGAEYNEIIMSASSAPIDEDMSDAIFPTNTGVFVYTKSNE